jgi:hypothetical protein
MKKGDRVVWTKTAFDCGIPSSKNRDSVGVIVSQSQDGVLWRVRWEGQKSASIYHKDFIKKTDQEAKRT